MWKKLNTGSSWANIITYSKVTQTATYVLSAVLFLTQLWDSSGIDMPGIFLELSCSKIKGTLDHHSITSSHLRFRDIRHRNRNGLRISFTSFGGLEFDNGWYGEAKTKGCATDWKSNSIKILASSDYESAIIENWDYYSATLHFPICSDFVDFI